MGICYIAQYYICQFYKNNSLKHEKRLIYESINNLEFLIKPIIEYSAFQKAQESQQSTRRETIRKTALNYFPYFKQNVSL